MVNATLDMKYNIHQVSSNFSHHITPVLNLTSEVERELQLFYDWSIQQVEKLSDLMRTSFLYNIEQETQVYFDELAADCLEWFLEEGKEMYKNFQKSLTPFFIQSQQLQDLRDSILRLVNRWNDLYEDIENIDEFEDVFQWLLDLPYLLEKRLRVFGIISDYRNMSLSSFGYVIQQPKLKTTLNQTSLSQTCFSYTFYRGCAS